MSESLEQESRRMLERRILTNYTLDEVKLQRLAFFFLVHSHIDIKLIALVVGAETEKLKRKGDSRWTTACRRIVARRCEPCWLRHTVPRERVAPVTMTYRIVP